jgi:hypothetical protein
MNLADNFWLANVAKRSNLPPKSGSDVIIFSRHLDATSDSRPRIFRVFCQAGATMAALCVLGIFAGAMVGRREPKGER